MKERIFTLLLAMIMLMPAMAQEVEDPGWSLNEETGELRIWKDFEDFKSSSEVAWRSSVGAIKNVVIEDGITKIASYSFSGCGVLTSVEIPNSVTSIGKLAFNGCSGLTSIDIPNSVTSIGSFAFYGCSGLTSVEIPNSVTSIANSAFNGCRGLTSVKIPNSVMNIENYAFEGCKKLEIVNYTGSMTEWLSIKYVDCGSAFRSNSARLYINGELVTDVIVPEGITQINDHAFCSYKHIKSVIIPNGVTTIGSSAFEDCSGLTSVEIPSSVTSIGKSAFVGCKKMEIVNYTGSITEWLNIEYENCGTAFHGNSTRLYINGELVTDVIVPEGVKQINGHAFCKYKHIKSIIIPEGVTSIGECAFFVCRGLTSVVIPNSVTSIGKAAFSKCSGLTSVEIPNSVTSIANSAFETCENLTTVYTDKEDPTILKSALGTSITYIVPCDFSDELLAKYTDARLTVKKEWHNFTNYVYNGDASLEADGTETAECDRDGCEVTDTRTAEGTKHAGTPTSVKKIDAGHSHKARKVVVNGRLMIEKDGEMYDLAGQKM